MITKQSHVSIKNIDFFIPSLFVYPVKKSELKKRKKFIVMDSDQLSKVVCKVDTLNYFHTFSLHI